MEFHSKYVIKFPDALGTMKKKSHPSPLMTLISMLWSIAWLQWKYHEKQCRAVTTRHYTHFKHFSITWFLPSPILPLSLFLLVLPMMMMTMMCRSYMRDRYFMCVHSRSASSCSLHLSLFFMHTTSTQSMQSAPFPSQYRIRALSIQNKYYPEAECFSFQCMNFIT